MVPSALVYRILLRRQHGSEPKSCPFNVSTHYHIKLRHAFSSDILFKGLTASNNEIHKNTLTNDFSQSMCRPIKSDDRV